MSCTSGAVAARPIGDSSWRVWQCLGRVAREDPERIAVEEFGPGGPRRRWSYAELCARASSIAAGLSGRTRPGETVLLDGEGGAMQIAWMLAAIRAGLWVLPVPMQTVADELRDLHARSGAGLVVGPSRRLESCEWIDWSAIEFSGSEPPADRDPGGVILETSGTAGRKKLVMRDARALDADAANILAATSLRGEDRVLLSISLSHSYAIDLVVGSVAAGATMETVPAFDLSAIVRRLTAGATVFPGVPFLFEGLATRWDGRGDLRLAFSAGARMPCSTRRAFARATGRPIGDLYGSTELGTVIFRDPARGEHEPGLIGTPLPGVSARVLDRSSGRVLGAGEEGELAIASPSMLRGYVGGPADLVQGHFVTGDLARMDERGRVFLTGRTKFVIEAGGLKFNPIELEELIESHPKVRECLVAPMPASATITRIRAIIVPEPGEPPTDAELRGFLRTKVGPAKIPRRFEMVESLPKSVAGKLLRSPFDGGHG